MSGKKVSNPQPPDRKYRPQPPPASPKRRFKDIVTILLKEQGVKPKTPRPTPKGRGGGDVMRSAKGFKPEIQGYQPDNGNLGVRNPPKSGSGILRISKCLLLGKCVVLKEI